MPLLPISLDFGERPVLPMKYSGWRVLHKAEGGYQKTPLGMPEVIPPNNPVAVAMTEAIQRMSYSLMTTMNAAITPALWSKVHDRNIAFTNYQSWGLDENTGEYHRRANFVMGVDQSQELPKYDKAQRLCGGQFVRGRVVNDKLVCVPGVDGIDVRYPLPSVAQIIERNWYLFAVSYHATRVEHFPQGQGGPVAIPFIFDREIEFDLNLLERWESDELPDPLKLYRSV
jgi:hypothetical protein